MPPLPISPILMIIAAFSGIICILIIIGIITITGLRILKGGVSPASRKFREEEAGMIQEIYQGLSRMETRVDALETILLDKKRKDPAP